MINTNIIEIPSDDDFYFFSGVSGLSWKSLKNFIQFFLKGRFGHRSNNINVYKRPRQGILQSVSKAFTSIDKSSEIDFIYSLEYNIKVSLCFE